MSRTHKQMDSSVDKRSKGRRVECQPRQVASLHVTHAHAEPSEHEGLVGILRRAPLGQQ